MRYAGPGKSALGKTGSSGAGSARRTSGSLVGSGLVTTSGVCPIAGAEGSAEGAGDGDEVGFASANGASAA